MQFLYGVMSIWVQGLGFRVSGLGFRVVEAEERIECCSFDVAGWQVRWEDWTLNRGLGLGLRV